MKKDNTIETFFALLRAGLWSSDNLNIRINESSDWQKVYQFACEQNVTGLILAGLEHSKVKPPQEILLQWIGEVQIIEQRNKFMNQFIAELVAKMRLAGIYAVLVKGQGVGQCYETPLWRTCGDIDFLLSEDNYLKAIKFLLPQSNTNKYGGFYSKEYALTINPWMIELHGSLRTGLSSRVDKQVDAVQNDVFYGGNVRSWENGHTTIFLPSPDNDVFFIFTHFIKHFYKEGGSSIRQLCDWCRILWAYKDTLKYELLESRIMRAGLMSEWKSFATVAVKYLGMPVEAMPLYSENKKWERKADKIVDFIIKGREWRKYEDTITVGKIFPLSTFRFLPGILLSVNWLKIKERILSGSNI